MLTKALTALAIIALAATVATARQAQPAAKASEAAVPAAAIRPVPPAQLVNIRIDLTVTEQRDGAKLPPRAVTMLLGDRESGRVRTSHGGAAAMLNVDARPEIVRDGRIRVSLTLEYRPQATEGEKLTPSLLSESVSSILDDGKPLVVSQSADPTSARTAVVVEVKATIVK